MSAGSRGRMGQCAWVARASWLVICRSYVSSSPAWDILWSYVPCGRNFIYVARWNNSDSPSEPCENELKWDLCDFFLASFYAGMAVFKFDRVNIPKKWVNISFSSRHTVANAPVSPAPPSTSPTLCLTLFLCLSHSPCLPICVVFLCLSVPLSVFVSVCLRLFSFPVSVSLSLSLSLSAYMSCLSLYVASLSLPLSLSMFLPVSLPVPLSPLCRKG